MSKVGYIYKIKDNTNGDVYYGSTTQTVSRRIAQHRTTFNAGMKTGACSSLIILKNGNWSYFTVEKFLYAEKFELRNREQYYIDNNECINKTRAYCSIEQHKEREKIYREENKERIYELGKLYREENKEQFKVYMKIYREENNEKIKEQKKLHREENNEKITERDRKYYEENKETILEQRQKYYEKNKELINKRQTERRRIARLNSQKTI